MLNIIMEYWNEILFIYLNYHKLKGHSLVISIKREGRYYMRKLLNDYIFDEAILKDVLVDVGMSMVFKKDGI